MGIKTNIASLEFYINLLLIIKECASHCVYVFKGFNYAQPVRSCGRGVGGWGGGGYGGTLNVFTSMIVIFRSNVKRSKHTFLSYTRRRISLS